MQELLSDETAVGETHPFRENKTMIYSHSYLNIHFKGYLSYCFLFYKVKQGEILGTNLLSVICSYTCAIVLERRVLTELGKIASKKVSGFTNEFNVKKKP